MGGQEPTDLTSSLWPRTDAAPRRGPKPRLALTTVIDAAVAVADTEGLEAVSMQRVAEAVGFTKMALYRHVAGKPQLLALMLDAAIGPPPHTAEATDWMAQLRHWALQMADALAAHPWAVELAVGPRVFGPNELGWMEAGLTALTPTGYEGADALDALALIAGHTRSVVAQRQVTMISSQAAADHPDDTERAIGEALVSILDERGSDYPQTRDAFRSAMDGQQTGRALEFGIDRILAGLTAGRS